MIDNSIPKSYYTLIYGVHMSFNPITCVVFSFLMLAIIWLLRSQLQVGMAKEQG